MLDDMDNSVKLILFVVVGILLLFLAIPVIIILAAVIGAFVLGLGEEAVLLAPVCGPTFARRLRRLVPA